jgi:hypothetical protein
MIPRGWGVSWVGELWDEMLEGIGSDKGWLVRYYPHHTPRREKDIVRERE